MNPSPQVWLEVSEHGKSWTVPFLGAPLSIGRAAGAGIAFSSGFVSSTHAVIEVVSSGAASSGVVLRDLNSTNGTLVDGVAIGGAVSSAVLRDGSLIRIGDPSSGSFVSLVFRNSSATQRRSALQSKVLQGTVFIGRLGSGSALELDHSQVSRVHARLELVQGAWVLRDWGSSNGTLVNGVKISQATLKAGDVIFIGSYRLMFDGAKLEWSEPGGVRLDALGLVRNTAKGRILNDVSLTVLPREFVALVGGSGAGKSTLMKALCGFVPADKGSKVLWNSEDFYARFANLKNQIGYVPQDDIIHKTLSVRRALEFAAQLRLPRDLSRLEIAGRIDAILTQLRLEPHQHKLVEKLSGGQRKRVSIAVELLSEPDALFLDEPTSGLDPGLEKQMMFSLRQLADAGRTVVLVTHATQNIEQCDLVAFMAQGRLVYYGIPSEACAFFNLAHEDFADIYTQLEQIDPSQITAKATEFGLQAELAALSSPKSIAEVWEAKFKASSQYQKFVVQRQAQLKRGMTTTAVAAVAAAKPVSLWHQFFVLARRYLELMLQDRQNSLILLAQVPIIAGLLMLMVGADWLKMTTDPSTRYNAQTVLFMLATISVWFGIINAAREITKERPILERERAFNLRLVPYLAAKFVVLAIVALVQAVLLVGLLGFKLEYPQNGAVLAGWLELLATCTLASWGGVALGLLVSASAATPDRAVSLVPIMLVPQIMFAGLIFKLDGAAKTLSWGTISHWSMNALGTSVNLNLHCNDPFPCKNRELYSFTLDHLLRQWGILAAMLAVFLLLTGILLKSQERRKS